ncbi:TPA: hypothetical protein U1C93_001513 [Streptococcus suis]|nr:hypothetical protein [Streptococcus suis]
MWYQHLLSVSVSVSVSELLFIVFKINRKLKKEYYLMKEGRYMLVAAVTGFIVGYVAAHYLRP